MKIPSIVLAASSLATASSGQTYQVPADRTLANSSTHPVLPPPPMFWSPPAPVTTLHTNSSSVRTIPLPGHSKSAAPKHPHQPARTTLAAEIDCDHAASYASLLRPASSTVAHNDIATIIHLPQSAYHSTPTFTLSTSPTPSTLDNTDNAILVPRIPPSSGVGPVDPFHPAAPALPVPYPFAPVPTPPRWFTNDAGRVHIGDSLTRGSVVTGLASMFFLAFWGLVLY